MIQRVPVAIIGKAHGLNGWVKVRLLTNVHNIFDTVEEVYLERAQESNAPSVEAHLESVRRTGTGLLLKIRGIDTLQQAKKLTGLHICVAVDKLPVLSKDEYYFYELLNMEVFNEQGTRLGRVTDVIETGSNDVLVVSENGEEKLFPLVKDYIICLEKGKKAVVKEPEWI